MKLCSFTKVLLNLYNLYIYSNCALTEYGIFISSILLSAGAFIAQILAQIQKSKCKTINCLGSSCIREVEP